MKLRSYYLNSLPVSKEYVKNASSVSLVHSAVAGIFRYPEPMTQKSEFLCNPITFKYSVSFRGKKKVLVQYLRFSHRYYWKKIVLELRTESNRRTEFSRTRECLQSLELIKRKKGTESN